MIIYVHALWTVDQLECKSVCSSYWASRSIKLWQVSYDDRSAGSESKSKPWKVSFKSQ